MIQAHVYISGFVQGVGYRQFVKRKAQELGLTGWVKNLPDARVEAVFQGKKEDIEKMITLCKKGPFLAEVEDIHIIWEESQEVYRDFTIV
ncbi:MAG: acylphosphatase [Candidatus Levybacteria bacterium]|nr:acylphosphatase [Candidatus Levybacteria bacterium]